MFDIDDVKVGDIWHTRKPGAIALSTVEITEITEFTIEMRDTSIGAQSVRYGKREPQYIERVAEGGIDG